MSVMWCNAVLSFKALATVCHILYLMIAYNATAYDNIQINLGWWFLQSIDDDTLDLVSMDDLIVGSLFTILLYRT